MQNFIIPGRGARVSGRGGFAPGIQFLPAAAPSPFPFRHRLMLLVPQDLKILGYHVVGLPAPLGRFHSLFSAVGTRGRRVGIWPPRLLGPSRCPVPSIAASTRGSHAGTNKVFTPCE